MPTRAFTQRQNKLIGYVLLFIAPFLSFLLALMRWDKPYAKNMIIGVIVFIGMTALPEGDLQYYQDYYYYNSNLSFEAMLHNFIGLKEAKFYINLLSFSFGLIFEHHALYFGFLYFIFGYYLINFIYLAYEHNNSATNTSWGVFLFLTFALFFSIRSSLNMAFYSGAIFILYYISKSILQSNTKMMWPILLAPLFHIALILVFIPIILFSIFKSRTYACAALVIISYAPQQSTFQNLLGDFSSDKDGSIIKERYDNYASENGKELLDRRYAEASANANFKLSLLNNIKDFLFNYLLNIGLVIIFLYRKKLNKEIVMLKLYNLILLFWALSNVMLDISNGNRFQTFQMTLTVLYLLLSYEKFTNRVQRLYYFFTFPLLSIYGFLNLYAANKFISANFFVSNFLIEIVSLFHR